MHRIKRWKCPMCGQRAKNIRADHIPPRHRCVSNNVSVACVHRGKKLSDAPCKPCGKRRADGPLKTVAVFACDVFKRCTVRKPIEYFDRILPTCKRCEAYQPVEPDEDAEP